MQLSDLLGAFGSDPTANYQSILSQIPNAATSLGNLYGAAQNIGTQNSVNQAAAPAIAQNTTAMQQQIATLQAQQAQQAQDAQNQYQAAQATTNASNAQLQGTIGTQTNALNALSDPNSAYMQNAQASINAQDAAAGRNSQWGQRAVQLAGTLGQYVSQYSPGITNSITSAQNQINQNNQGLANVYNTAYKPDNDTTNSQIKALQDQITSLNSASAQSRQNATAAQNAVTGTGGLVQSAGNTLSSLMKLFGGGSTAQPWGSATNTTPDNAYSTSGDQTLTQTPEADMGMGSYYSGLGGSAGQQYGASAGNYDPDQYDDSEGLYNF